MATQPAVDAKKAGRRFKMPDTYVLLFFIIILMAVATWFVPAGAYDRVADPNTGRNIVVAGSYRVVESSPVGLLGVLTSVPRGMVEAGAIVFLVFIMGGAFNIIISTGAFDAGFGYLLKRFKGREKVVPVILLLIFTLSGAMLGWAEEGLIFMPILVAFSLTLGFDSMVGAGILLLGMNAGFVGAFMNPFTTGVAQSIAELPLFSGFAFRFCVYLVLSITAAWYVYRYANKIQKDPSKSLMRDLDAVNWNADDRKLKAEAPPITARFRIVYLTIVAGFGILIWGCITQGWYLAELGGIFFAVGIISGLVCGYNLDRIAKEWATGMASVAAGAIIVGFCRAIPVVMADGHILDTLVKGLAEPLATLPKYVAGIGMYVSQLITEFFISSGSGQAAAVMPILTPLADVIGITRQTAVLALQYGDGIPNILFPTSGYFMAGLAMAKVPYQRWLKFVWPLVAIQLVLCAVFITIAVAINLGPF